MCRCSFAAILVVTSTVATHGRHPQDLLPVILLLVLILAMLNNRRIDHRAAKAMEPDDRSKEVA
jgi:hypothetical protein